MAALAANADGSWGIAQPYERLRAPRAVAVQRINALLLEGYKLHDEPIQLGPAAIERLRGQ
ncbi:hypothetical protein BO86DRAFT_404276 [Aspergillus japonicus CBS 114.51]|uniref:Uncharacterized protein n=1 Tax=Aspergillus japonicus CBS 114.51 TaxID=1448312 RepID=A0A8T8WN97_ASPJA|nr:hypothetical protein BO86DRAFT_404276 [Aspergillus japonicus CBS 114.51]RAH76879.1 hypothetical protein BO86DRAFT_404276 [Aspergillus japonicus CBS 114.51]